MTRIHIVSNVIYFNMVISIRTHKMGSSNCVTFHDHRQCIQ